MSEELEWELMDIFESGMFVFPIYDHKSARRIVRYLLMRGILDEEIADAIEDSTGDLHIWLNRGGKFQVGEWVIAWMNEVRDEYKKDKRDQQRLGHYTWDDDIFIRALADDESDDDDSDDYHDHTLEYRRHDEHRSDSRLTDLESISSNAATSTTAELPMDNHDMENNTMHGTTDSEVQTTADVVDTENKEFPPPLPPRSVTTTLTTIDQNGITFKTKTLRPNNLDLSRHESLHRSSSEGLYEAPDSGHFSDLYTCIPPDQLLDTLTVDNLENHPQFKLCKYNLDDSSTSTASPKPHNSNCSCILPHYSYISGNANNNEGSQMDCQDTPTSPHEEQENHDPEHYCDIYFTDENGVPSRAMEFTFDTLDRDGPGYIFIMTDSLQNCLPWSSEHRYKIASSRQPERCLTEFRTRNIDIELIWQVKVTSHLKAAREVQGTLEKYNLHSNWFRCSLSVIMEAVSKVVKKYK